MSNTTRKAWALTATAAVGASSLVMGVAPASAAPFAMEAAPTTGTNWVAFSTDQFNFDVTMPTLINQTIADTNFAMAITNSDSTNLTLTFGMDSDGTYDTLLLDADGDPVGTEDDTAVADGVGDAIDFDTVDATTLVVSNFKGAEGQAFGVNDILVEMTNGAFDDGGTTLGITVWTDVDGDFTTIDASTAASYTLTFVDPNDVSVITKLERTVGNAGNYLNLADDTVIVGSVKFSRTLNLTQVDWADWEFDLYRAGAKVDDNIGFYKDDTYLGFGTDTDDAGKQLARFDVAEGGVEVLVEDTSFQIKAFYSGEASARVFSSNAVTPAKSPSATNDGVSIAITESDDALEVNATTSTLRTGQTQTTYVVQAKAGADDTAIANIPTIIRLESEVGSASIVGAVGTAEEDKAILWNTLTDADGQVTVTVNHATAAADDQFDLDVFMLNSNGTATNLDEVTATYADGVQSTMEMSSTVLTGETLTLTATIKDQFGVAVSEDSDGDALSVEVAATDTDNLKIDAAAVDGVATLTFANFLAAGETDVLTVSAFTEDTDTVTNLSDSSVTLYADVTVAGVNTTAEEVDAVVQYVEFSDAAVLDGDDPVFTDTAAISGSVVDGEGNGIPGAQVSVSGAGLQFENADGDYFVDSMSITATEAGTFTFNVYTHIADDVDVTITSGGESATVTVAGALPSGAAALSAANLVIDWNLADAVVYNTTYAVTATVKDVWGNGVPNAELTFTGEAAAQFNSDDTAVKTTNSDGEATAYLRSLADISGLAAVSLTLSDNIDWDADNTDDVTDVGDTFDDVTTTSWDESEATDLVEEEVNFLTSAPAASSDTKVNAGSFKGYVAVYARGYEGQRLSAKIGNDWVIVDPIVNNQGSDLHRTTDFTGAGVDIAVRIYIDRVLIDTINLTTK